MILMGLGCIHYTVLMYSHSQRVAMFSKDDQNNRLGWDNLQSLEQVEEKLKMHKVSLASIVTVLVLDISQKC